MELRRFPPISLPSLVGAGSVFVLYLALQGVVMEKATTYDFRRFAFCMFPLIGIAGSAYTWHSHWRRLEGGKKEEGKGKNHSFPTYLMYLLHGFYEKKVKWNSA